MIILHAISIILVLHVHTDCKRIAAGGGEGAGGAEVAPEVNF